MKKKLLVLFLVTTIAYGTPTRRYHQIMCCSKIPTSANPSTGSCGNYNGALCNDKPGQPYRVEESVYTETNNSGDKNCRKVVVKTLPNNYVIDNYDISKTSKCPGGYTEIKSRR